MQLARSLPAISGAGRNLIRFSGCTAPIGKRSVIERILFTEPVTDLFRETVTPCTQQNQNQPKADFIYFVCSFVRKNKIYYRTFVCYC